MRRLYTQEQLNRLLYRAPGRHRVVVAYLRVSIRALALGQPADPQLLNRKAKVVQETHDVGYYAPALEGSEALGYCRRLSITAALTQYRSPW